MPDTKELQKISGSIIKEYLKHLYLFIQVDNEWQEDLQKALESVTSDIQYENFGEIEDEINNKL